MISHLCLCFSGDMEIISQLGISKELIDEHEGAAGRQKKPQMMQEDIDFKQNVLDQMNEVETDEPEHLQKAKELSEELTQLRNDHKLACARSSKPVHVYICMGTHHACFCAHATR